MRKKWEYYAKSTRETLSTRELCAIGDMCWELVSYAISTDVYGSHFHYVFKRPVQMMPTVPPIRTPRSRIVAFGAQKELVH